MSKHCLTCGRSTQPVSQVLCGNCLRAKEKHRSVFIDSLLHYCLLPWDTREVFFVWYFSFEENDLYYTNKVQKELDCKG